LKKEKGCIKNIFNKIIVENFLNFEKDVHLVKETSSTLNSPDQNMTSSHHILVKTLSTENKERILKATRGKYQVTYNESHQKNSIFLNRNLKSKEGIE
jgi:hypothetical protein